MESALWSFQMATNNIVEHIEVLTKHNHWRRCNDENCGCQMGDIKKIGLSIDAAIEVMQAHKPPVTGRLLPPEKILIIADSAIMFDLMIEHKVILDFTVVYIGSDKCEYVLARQNGVWGKSALVSYKDHGTPQEAARFAIARYLVNLAEDK